MLFGSHCHSVGKGYEVVSWLLVLELVLVDACLSWRHELGTICCCSNMVVQFGYDPWVQHHKLDHEVLSNVWLP